MKARLAIVLVLVLAASCGDSSGPASQLTSLGPLSFEVPLEWQHTDSVRDRSATVVWSPSNNQRKESVTVIRTQRQSHGAPNVDTLERELVTAQRTLRDAKPSRISRVTTRHGFTGARLEVSFRPDTVDRTYRRTHVVLVEDERTLIHVFYTAAIPDDDRIALELVLETLTKEGAS